MKRCSQVMKLMRVMEAVREQYNTVTIKVYYTQDILFLLKNQ